MKKIAANRNYKAAQVIETDPNAPDRRYPVSIYPGPTEPGSGPYKNWADYKSPDSIHQGWVEGFDSNTSRKYTSRELLRILKSAIATMKAEDPAVFNNEINALDLVTKDLDNLRAGGGKFVMYHK